jgi:hypothetical protein
MMNASTGTELMSLGVDVRDPHLIHQDASIAIKAVSQLLWSHKGREEWFSLGENHERLFRSVEKHFQDEPAELQIPRLRSG